MPIFCARAGAADHSARPNASAAAPSPCRHHARRRPLWMYRLDIFVLCEGVRTANNRVKSRDEIRRQFGREQDVSGLIEVPNRHAPLPSRRSAIQPFIVMDVMRAAADREQAGGRVIHMEVGQPAAPAPAPVIAAADAALKRGRIAYTEALGLRALRRRIAQYYGE